LALGGVASGVSFGEVLGDDLVVYFGGVAERRLVVRGEGPEAFALGPVVR